MKSIYHYIIIALIVLIGSSACSDYLDREPSNIITNEQVFADPNMTNSVVANFYGRVDWGQRISDFWQYMHIDEACRSSDGPDNRSSYENEFWRVYDYTLIRHINEFLINLRSDKIAGNLDKDFRTRTEAEVRFLRAWTYFNMVRCLGGVPIVNDEVFAYSKGMDMTPLQVKRATEAETYDYVISECTAIASMLSVDRTINAARVNKWSALTLKAKAAIYAASIAKYNNLLPDPIKTTGGEVGIPAEKANGYYETALAAAKDIIASQKYSLYNVHPDKGINFYNALAIKGGNPEVIWSLDYKYPGKTTNFTTENLPNSVKEDIDATCVTPVLNLVEDFEFKDNRDGKLKTKDENGNYIFYENASDIFKNKDGRLYGTVIYPGSTFRNTEIVFQAGRKKWENGQWVNEIGALGATDSQGNLITSPNGPNTTNNQWQNKAGFCIRKFLDENKDSGTRGRGSEMWFVRMRYADVLLIAAEAAMELNITTEALGYINQVRERAGIQALTSLTIDDILRERRVEFAFENQRWWDLKRTRKAHLIWNGINGDPNAQIFVLFPYKVYNPGNANHNKWVFDKQRSHMAPNPRFFEMRNYYNFYSTDWISRNPNLVKNPYQ